MTDLNLQFFHWINLAAPAPVALLWLARMASTVLPSAMLVGVCGALFLRAPGVRRTMAMTLLAMALAWLMARGLTELWPTSRPFVLGLGHQWLEHKPTPSFPSSHASLAFAMGLALWLRLQHRLWRWAPLVAAVLISWSRVALGLHFPLDVLAGLAVGVASASLASQLLPPRVADRAGMPAPSET